MWNSSPSSITCDRSGNIQAIETNIKRIVGEVAEECKLLLEGDKEDVLHLRKRGKKTNVDRRYVKWLGTILTTPWISTYTEGPRLPKPGKHWASSVGWGSLSGVWPRGDGRMRVWSGVSQRGGQNWDGGDKGTGSEDSAGGQALRKATSAVQSSSGELVNWMVGAEDVFFFFFMISIRIRRSGMAKQAQDVATNLDNSQARFMARCVEDPWKLGGIIPMGFGDESIVNDELTEEGVRRSHRPQ